MFATATNATSASTTPTITSLSLYTGSTATALSGPQPYGVGPTQTIAMNFSAALSTSQVSYTVAGSNGSKPSTSLYPVNYGKTMKLQMSPTAGVTYTVNVTAPSSYSFTFTALSSTATPAPATSATATPAPTASLTTTSSTTTSGVSISGLKGSTAVSVSGSQPYSVGYSEVVNVNLPSALSSISGFSYTIKGSNGTVPATTLYLTNYGKQVQMTVNKTPGVVYTVSITKPVVYAFQFTTPASVSIPGPIASTLGQPYRYGVLEHPFPFSLGSETCSTTSGVTTCTLNASSQQQVQLLCNAHVRFVRIDYPAQGILTNGTGTALLSTPNFAQEDAILKALHVCGITELPIILQYSAGSVLTGGAAYPHAFRWPTATNGTPGYADFAKDVVLHLKQVAPWVTRVELYNEPNLSGWDDFPVNGNESVIDGSGKEAAIYMKAAYAAVKSANSAMTVVGPALADGGSDTDPRKFLQTMYANGCRTNVCWNVLSVHNYDWENPTFAKAAAYQNQWGIYKQLQAIAVQNGDPTPHVMLTEWGFSTLTTSSQGFDPTVQARYLALGFNLMLADPTVDGIVYVNVYNPGTDFWGRTALTSTGYALLPGYSTYANFASH